MAECVQATTSPDLRPNVHLGLKISKEFQLRQTLSPDTVLDGLPIVAPINLVTALIYKTEFVIFVTCKKCPCNFRARSPRSVLGDTPTSPVVAFVLLRLLTDLLKEARSLPTF